MSHHEKIVKFFISFELLVRIKEYSPLMFFLEMYPLLFDVTLSIIMILASNL